MDVESETLNQFIIYIKLTSNTFPDDIEVRKTKTRKREKFTKTKTRGNTVLYENINFDFEVILSHYNKALIINYDPRIISEINIETFGVKNYGINYCLQPMIIIEDEAHIASEDKIRPFYIMDLSNYDKAKYIINNKGIGVYKRIKNHKIKHVFGEQKDDSALF